MQKKTTKNKADLGTKNFWEAIKGIGSATGRFDQGLNILAKEASGDFDPEQGVGFDLDKADRLLTLRAEHNRKHAFLGEEFDAGRLTLKQYDRTIQELDALYLPQIQRLAFGEAYAGNPMSSQEIMNGCIHRYLHGDYDNAEN